MSTRNSKYNLSSGWNLISNYGFINNSLINIFNDLSNVLIENTLYSYNNGYELINLSDNLVSGKGYWIKLKEPVSFRPTGTCQTFSINYTKGWNIISTPFNSNFDLSTSDLSSIIVKDSLYEYTANGYNIVSNLIIEPGKGYWIKLLEDKQITFKCYSIFMEDDNSSGWFYGGAELNLELYNNLVNYNFSPGTGLENETIYFTVPAGSYTAKWGIAANSTYLYNVLSWRIDYTNNTKKKSISNVFEEEIYSLNIGITGELPIPPKVNYKLTKNFCNNVTVIDSNGNSILYQSSEHNIMFETGLKYTIYASNNYVPQQNTAGYFYLSDNSNNNKILLVGGTLCSNVEFIAPINTETIKCPVYPITIDYNHPDFIDALNNDQSIFESKFDVFVTDFSSQEIAVNGFIVRDYKNGSPLITIANNFWNSLSAPKFWWYYKNSNNELVKYQTYEIPDYEVTISNNLIFKETSNTNTLSRGLLDSVFSSTRIYKFIEKTPSLHWIYNSWQTLVNSVNLNNYGNAYYSGGRVHYYQGNNTVNKTVLLNVQGHEYGHGIHIIGLQSGSYDRELGEGFADFVGLLVEYDTFKVWQSIIGRFFYVSRDNDNDGEPDGIRNVDPNLIYPFNWDNNGQSSPHGDGLIFGGSMFDIANLANINTNLELDNILEQLADIVFSAIRNGPSLGGSNGIGNYIVSRYNSGSQNNINYSNDLKIPLLLGLQNHGLINMEFSYKYNVDSSYEVTINNTYELLFIYPNTLSQQYSNDDPIYNNTLTVTSNVQNSNVGLAYITADSDGNIGKIINTLNFGSTLSHEISNVESLYLFSNQSVTFTITNLERVNTDNVRIQNNKFVVKNYKIDRNININKPVNHIYCSGCSIFNTCLECS